MRNKISALILLVALCQQAVFAGLPPVSFTAVGSTPSSTAASCVGNRCTLQPADATHPGLVSSLPLPILNGGFGASMITQTVSSSSSNSLTPGTIKLTNVAPVVNGIVAGTNGQVTYLYPTAGVLTITHNNGGATAANRIQTPTTGSVNVPTGFRAELRYDTTVSRWILQDGAFITSVVAPMDFSSTGILSIRQASAAQSGFLSPSDWSTFNSKVAGSGSDKGLAVWTGTSNLTGDNRYLSFDFTTQRLGVGIDKADVSATVHASSSVPITVPNPTVFNATLVQFPLPTSPVITITQGTPDISNPGATPTAINLGTGGYSPSDVIDYQVRGGYDNGVDPVIWGVSFSSLTGVTGDTVNTFDVQFALSGGGNFGSNVWTIQRSVNGGGPDWQQTTDTGFIDANAGWGGEPDTSNRADDFLANGTNYSGITVAHGTVTSPISTVIVDGTGYSPGFVDDNSGTAYKMSVVVQGVGGSLPVRMEWPGTRKIETSVDFVSGPIGLSSAGAPVLTPTTYGYLSDGAILSVDYSFYASATLAGTLIYSPASLDRSTVDPNDGLYYYITLDGFSPGSGKVVKQNNSTGKLVVAAATIYDDGVTTFPNGTSVSPQSYLPPALIAEGAMAATGGPQVVLKAGAGENYTRQDFQDGTGAIMSSIYGNSSYLGMQMGNSYVRVATGSYALNGAVGQIGGTNLLVDATTLGKLTYNTSERLRWDNDGIKVNNASTGYESGLEVQSKNASYATASFKLRSGQTQVLTQWIDASNSALASVSSTGQGSFAGLSITDAKNVALSGTTGTKFGTATTQKLAFYNSTPVVQQTGNPVTALTTLGLLASPTAITETQGGTNQTTYAQGDLLYASASNTLSKLAKSTSATRYLANTGTSNNPAWAQIDLTNGVTGALPGVNGGSGRVTPLSAALSFTANLTSVVSNQIVAYGKISAAATIQNMVAEATSFTCVSNPTFTLYDCGTSVGACTTGRTALASVTLTATGGADGTVTTPGIAAGHYWAVETTGGTCTTLTTTGTADYQ